MKVFKLCIFGDGGVGKSTLIHRYLHKVFDEDLKMTIGADFSIKDLKIDGKNIRLRIWDFAGEERYKVLFPSYVKGASGGLYIYDTTRYNSLRKINDWISFFRNEEKISKTIIPIVIVGSKIDLEEYRSVELEDAKHLSEKYQLQGFNECSAKTGENVETIFDTITREIMKNEGLL